MFSETDFTQGKSHFHPATRIPNSSLLFDAALSQNGWIAVYYTVEQKHKGHEKAFLRPLTMR